MRSATAIMINSALHHLRSARQPFSQPWNRPRPDSIRVCAKAHAHACGRLRIGMAMKHAKNFKGEVHL